MSRPPRTVRVEPVELGDRTVLAVVGDDQRRFEFGEPVIAVDERGGARRGTVTWDPGARWVVSLGEPDAHESST